MRHNRDEKRFDRTYSHLKSMMSNMTNDLITVGRIKTTTQRAKALRSWAEKMITLGKNGTTAARRRAMAFLRNKTSVTRLFADLAPQYKERNGGYTRILKLGNRPGDNASMSLIEFVEGAGEKAPEAAPKAAKAKKKAPAKAKAAPKAKAEKTEKAEKAEKAPRKTVAKKAKAEKTAEKTTEKKAPAKRVKKETKPKE
ncbi:MAG TPA: 50S ribosomal protein L17 [Thermodesulfobacteriota bacterium]|nr:50S ribosomal protein L17 [Thermodesulfobacteriota bacterium]